MKVYYEKSLRIYSWWTPFINVVNMGQLLALFYVIKIFIYIK